MKTKSKRFVNLATLCLALLGTTLLMEQPVRAEVVTKVQQDEKADWYRGYEEGLKKGKAASQREDLVRKEIPVPEGVSDKGEYWDGFETGYSAGWYQNHDFVGGSDSGTSSNQSEQEEQESNDPSQDDGGVQGSEDSGSQQENTISPIVQAVLNVLTNILDSFLTWLDS
ncbi:TPA: hypothetical protein VLM34_000742 [Streptococcus pyogenes]|uniref:hypothetical protein n=1 Tax=Streptococcus pyogenes TaxID=1314 RepID=UPI00109D7EEF|nr:hypothetical protein [Streptococcus pyogenes]QCK44428.1 hypothetical protein ETT62_07305 [Streptococcus pyogenes]VHF57913.1 Uncharacterised protein [Streptococcus pyogenes]VHG43712.1 Uncharacterised protein [Streptococcus pyogenes]VHK20950.1 hypothetical membrane associated protein [Streptococcus pyogenes]VHM07014.1 hypothetical membrane associated protein [Streptococcus pyogenes]